MVGHYTIVGAACRLAGRAPNWPNCCSLTSDGTKVAFFYHDPDRVKHNFPTVYIVGADGNSQPTMVNLSESDAKKLAFATFLRWS